MDFQTVTQLGANLIEAAARNGASVINTKIKTAKVKKDAKQTISELEEIIYDLLSDKAEIQGIAQAYEQELVSQKITEDDIKYITDNLLPILIEFVPDNEKEQIEQIKKILSVETLTIMQLIGFNYKKAIGEPLTMLLRKVIESKIPMDAKINVEYALAMAKIASDKDSTQRFYQLTNQQIPEE